MTLNFLVHGEPGCLNSMLARFDSWVLGWTHVSSPVALRSRKSCLWLVNCCRNDMTYAVPFALWSKERSRGDPWYTYFMKYQVYNHSGHCSTWQTQVMRQFVHLHSHIRVEFRSLPYLLLWICHVALTSLVVTSLVWNLHLILPHAVNSPYCVPDSISSLGPATWWDDLISRTVSHSEQLHNFLVIYTWQGPGRTSHGAQMKTVDYSCPHLVNKLQHSGQNTRSFIDGTRWWWSSLWWFM